MEGSPDPDARNVARTIYGTILVTALVAGLSEGKDIDAWQILVSITVTTIVFWLAHVYAELLSQRLAAGRRLTWPEIGAALDGELAMVMAGAPAGIALALSALGFYSTDTGVTLAIGAGTAALFGYGLALARQEGASGIQMIGSAVISASFGLVIVALNAFVH